MKYLNPPRLSALGLLLSAAMGLSACAAVSQQLEGYEQGWRRARVEAVLASPAHADERALGQRPIHLDCRTSPSAQADGGRYALVSYMYGGSPQLRRYVVAPLAPSGEGSQPQPGEQLAVQVRQCMPLRALSAR